MKFDEKLGFKQYWLKPLSIVLATGALAACGSLDEDPDPRSLNLTDVSVGVEEDQVLNSSVNQDLGDDVIYSNTTSPSNGSVQFFSNGDFEYTPNDNFNGADSFQIQAECDDCETATAEVEILVESVNDAPIVNSITLEATNLTPISYQIEASDVDGDALVFELISESSHAEVVLSINGELSYTPENPFNYEETLEFSVNDGITSVNSFINITSIAPSASLNPDNLSIELPVDDEGQFEIHLVNNSEVELNYSAEVIDISAPEENGATPPFFSQKQVNKIKMPTITTDELVGTNGNVIVKYSSVAGSSEKVKSLFSETEFRVKKHFAPLGLDVVNIQGKSDRELAKLINELNAMPEVLYAEPDYPVQVDLTPNDALFTQQWALNNEGQTGGTFDADIDGIEAWDSFTDGDQVVVAVIDTGVNYNHEDLANNMWVNPGEIAGNGIDDDENGFVDDIYGYDFVNSDGDPLDDHDHGSHCAGIIAAEGNNGIGISGTAHNAKIMAVKFLSSFGSGSTSGAIESVMYAVDNGADILSNSWGGGGFSQALEDAISYANENDVLFIAAAGNSTVDNDSSPHYPSSYEVENIISVASTDHNDFISGFSNFGASSVDLGAPGSDILSTVSDGGYFSYSGTSMATPFVSGAAVLIRSYFPNLTAIDVKNILMDTVDVIPSLEGKTVTGGRLNLSNALSQALALSRMVNIQEGASEGSVAPGEILSIPVNVNSLSRATGQYLFDVQFSLDNPEVSQLVFNLDLSVIPDLIAPSAISDLSVSGVSSTSLFLDWTNVGDDELVGNAKEILIAYATFPISESNWDEATIVSGISALENGQVQTAVVHGLLPSTEYYFAVKSVDDALNVSPISNVEFVMTLVGPVIDVTPAVIDDIVLAVGDTEEIVVTLGNLGDEILSYGLAIFESGASEVAEVKANPHGLNYSEVIPRGDVDNRIGQEISPQSGGPDSYGYTWKDSDEGGVIYDWNDISELGTSVTISDFGVRGPYDLGFDFEFYGEVFNQIWFTSSGIVTFQSTSSNCCSSQPIPSADSWNNLIAWAWDDLYPTSGYQIHYLAEAGKFTLQFTDYGEFGASGRITSQVILYSDGRIKLQYKEFTNGFDTLRSSVGIENSDGTDGLQVVFNDEYLHDELAIEFSNGPKWLSLSQSQGEVEPSLSNDITLTFDATAQTQGTYEADLYITSNDSSQPEVIIPLRMDVVLPE